MKLGLVTPVVTLAARTHAAWERDAGPAEIRRIAERADALGFDYLTCSEHVAIPHSAVAARGGRYYDPAATLGYVAAITRRIRLLTHVLVLPYHHPLEVAKRYGTLDRLSGGRLILGVGVGSLEEEFDLLGIPFADRGPRFEDGLRALRAALGRTDPAYEGSHYRFSGFAVDPCAVQERPPIWLGGRSARSLRRALTFGDGWNPFGLGFDELRALIERARETSVWQQRLRQDHPFELALTPEPPLRLDSPGEIEEVRTTIRRYREIGASAVNLRFQHESLEHYLDLLQIFAEKVGSDPEDRVG